MYTFVIFDSERTINLYLSIYVAICIQVLLEHTSFISLNVFHPLEWQLSSSEHKKTNSYTTHKCI